MAWNPGYVSYGGYFSSIVPICHSPLFRYFSGSRDVDFGNYMQAYWEADPSRCHANFDQYQGIGGIGGAWIISQTGEPDFGFADLCKFPLTDGVHEPTKLVCLQLCAQSYDLETGIIQLGLRYVRKDLATNTIEYAQPMLGNQQLDIGTNVLILNSIHLCLQQCQDDQGHRYLNAALVLKISDGSDYYTVGSRALPLDIVGGVIPDGSEIDLTERDDPNQDDDGPSEEGGGGGSRDHTDDPVPYPDLPTFTAISGGFTTFYRVNLVQVELLASYLYTDNIWQMISNYFSQPSDMIAGLLMLPVKPSVGAAYKPKVGLHTFNIWLDILASQYVDVSCGSVLIDEYFSSCFDYSPYSAISIWLPFIGMRSLDIDEVMGKYIEVKYRVDCTNGDCIAFVLVGDASSKSVRYQFSGNCATQIPVSSNNMDSVIANAVQFATVAVATAATASAAGSAAGTAAINEGATIEETEIVAQSAQSAANITAAGDIGASAISTVMASKPTVERSGCSGGAIGFMGVLKPFVVRKAPRQSLPDGYASYYGYPSNISGTLGSFTGYTVVDTVKLKGIPGTDGEIAEIERSLRGGVII